MAYYITLRTATQSNPLFLRPCTTPSKASLKSVHNVFIIPDDTRTNIGKDKCYCNLVRLSFCSSMGFSATNFAFWGKNSRTKNATVFWQPKIKGGDNCFLCSLPQSH